MNKIFPTLALLLATAALALPASAQVDPNESEYARAQLLRGAQPEEALAAYRRLHEQTHAPRSLVQMGQLEAQLGRWVLADEHLSAALAAPADPWIDPRRTAVESNLAEVRRHVSEFTVVANIPGARLRLNGQDLGPLPLARAPRVAVGQVVIDLDAEGYEHLRETAQATPGRSRVELSLVPRRVVAPQVIAPMLAAAPSPATPGPTPSVANGSSTLRTVGLVGLIGGGVGLGVGVLGLLLRNGEVGAFADQGCWLDGARVMGGGSCQSAYDAGGAMQGVALAGFVGGGVLAAAGVTLFVIGGRGAAPTSERRASLVCGVGPGTVGVRCGGTW